MTELDSPFFYPYTGKSYCFYCKKPCEHDKFIDLYKKVKAKKDYVICLEHIKARSEHYLKLINEEGKEDIVRVIEEARNKLSKKRTMVEETKLESEREQEREHEEEKQPEQEPPRDRECSAYLEDAHKEEKHPIIDYSDVLEDDERYWKENYTDTPNQCHYCKDEFEYIAKKEDKKIRFCKKHYFERVEHSPEAEFTTNGWTFGWVNPKEKKRK